MASTPKQANGSSATNNGTHGKRKKSRGGKGLYLSKWLDKTMHHIQDSTPSLETYDSFTIPTMNWQTGSQFAPGYDQRHMYVEPLSQPSFAAYYPPMLPFGSDPRYVHSVNKSVQVQRPRMRRRFENRPEELQCTPLTNHNYLQPKNFTDSQDFTSLPPIVTSVVDTNSNIDMNTNEKDDTSNTRRFSDPCVRGLPDVAQPANGEMDSDSEASSGLSGSEVGSRLLTCLLDQIASLKMANERLSKDLLDMKMELENTQQHNAILQKGSNSSVGATPNHSLIDNGLHGGHYAPGFVTDVVREIRDAARLREEAHYSRVRNLVLERTDNGLASSEIKYMEKSLEEIKSAIRASEADKRLMMDRIIKLEDEIRLLRLTNHTDSNENKITNGNYEDPETERLRLRKEVADMRKGKQNAEEHAHKLERLVTQLRSKFNGLQLVTTNGPESLPSEPEHETNGRARRTSVNSTNNATVVFGPVTDL